MSEATIEALESEAFESAGEAGDEGEALGEAGYEGEALGEAGYEGEALGEAGYEAYGEDARSDARRRERQRRIMLARQRQAMLARQRQAQARRLQPVRRPAVTPPSQTVRAVRSEVRSLDLQTKVALDSLRARLDEANRMAYRNAWAAEASAAASQALDSFPGLEPHDWAKALIRGAPTLLIASPKRKAGIEGILLDPRVAGGAVLAGIRAIGHFRSASQDVSSIQVNYQGPLTVPGGANHTAQLTVAALNKAGKPVPNVQFTYTPQTAGLFTFNETSPGVVTLTGQAAGTTDFTVSGGGQSGKTVVIVTQGVSSIQVDYQGPLTVPGGANPTAQLTAVALNQAGSPVPNVQFTYTSQTAGLFTFNETSPGVVTLTGQAAGTTYFTVSGGGVNGGTFVTVT